MKIENISFISVTTALPIFAFDLSSQRHILELASEALKELRITHPNSIESNVFGEYVSPWRSHLLNPKLQPLCDLVLMVAKQATGEGYTGKKGDVNENLEIRDCWGAIYGHGGYTKSHHHHPAVFSAVVYLECDDNASPIIFGFDTKFPARQNYLYIFPGHMQHEVPANSAKRVVAAMNMYLKGTLPA